MMYLNENERAVFITQNGEAKAVIEDKKSYENLLKLIVQSENDIENCDVVLQEQMFNDLEKKLFD